MALVTTSAVYSVFHGEGHQYFNRLVLVLETGVYGVHFAAMQTNAVHATGFSAYHRIDAVFKKRSSELLELAYRLVPHIRRVLMNGVTPFSCNCR